MKKSIIFFVSFPSVIGRVDAIHVDKYGFLFGGADKRGDDTSIGY